VDDGFLLLLRIRCLVRRYLLAYLLNVSAAAVEYSMVSSFALVNSLLHKGYSYKLGLLFTRCYFTGDLLLELGTSSGLCMSAVDQENVRGDYDGVLEIISMKHEVAWSAYVFYHSQLGQEMCKLIDFIIFCLFFCILFHSCVFVIIF